MARAGLWRGRIRHASGVTGRYPTRCATRIRMWYRRAMAAEARPMLMCITADDYGLSPGVNAAIEHLAAAGAISAVSVMVHPDAHLDTLHRLTATGVALGLHVVLTRER